MPFGCCIPKCKGNFKNGPKVSVFIFPKEEEIKRMWIAAIQRKDFIPTKNSKVCELHFAETDFIKEARGFDERSGQVITAPAIFRALYI